MSEYGATLNLFAKLSLFALLLFLIVQIVLMAPGTLNMETEERPFVEEENFSQDVEQVMKGVHLVESSEGRQEWELWADRATSFRNKGLWSLKNVKIIFFSKDKKTFQVSGTEGIVELDTKNMEIKGNVILNSINGYNFKTQSMTYKSKTKSLGSRVPVKMLAPKDKIGHRMKLSGDGMNALIDSSIMNVIGNINARKMFKDNQEVRIQSEEAEFSGKTNYAKFKRKVIMDVDTMRITGPEAVFQYNSKEDFVESVLISGGARVSDVDKWATSEKVSAYFNENKFVFKGSPRLVQGNDELRGEQIVFLNGGRIVKVLKAKADVKKARIGGAN